jgi:hypothetical protein
MQDELGLTNTKTAVYIRKQGDNISQLSEIKIGDEDLVANQVKQLSAKGQIFNNLSAASQDKMINIYNSTKKVSSTSSGTTTTNDE